MARVDFGACVLQPEGGAPVAAVVRGSLMGPRKSLGNAVVVGDVTLFVEEGGRAAVSAIEPRRNAAGGQR